MDRPLEGKILMGRRRGNNEGSIYQLPNGRWRAALTIGYDENGKRKRRYLSGRTRADVVEQLTKELGRAISGTATQPGRTTVGEYVKDWLETNDEVRKTTSFDVWNPCKPPHRSASRRDSAEPIDRTAAQDVAGHATEEKGFHTTTRGRLCASTNDPQECVEVRLDSPESPGCCG